ncbi:MAG: hypothetical protein M3457_00630 [Chloroflexota bacterium]|nr:hypothetical protein [Chloroflexota bacterium]
MTTRFDIRGNPRAIMLACMFGLWLLVALPHPGAAQDAHDFTVTVDPLTSCQANTPITGTVTLIGLTTGYDFQAQLRSGGEIRIRHSAGPARILVVVEFISTAVRKCYRTRKKRPEGSRGVYPRSVAGSVFCMAAQRRSATL